MKGVRQMKEKYIADINEFLAGLSESQILYILTFRINSADRKHKGRDRFCLVSYCRADADNCANADYSDKGKAEYLLPRNISKKFSHSYLPLLI